MQIEQYWSKHQPCFKCLWCHVLGRETVVVDGNLLFGLFYVLIVMTVALFQLNIIDQHKIGINGNRLNLLKFFHRSLSRLKSNFIKRCIEFFITAIVTFNLITKYGHVDTILRISWNALSMWFCDHYVENSRRKIYVYIYLGTPFGIIKWHEKVQISCSNHS